jgi:nucleoside-diphosphate-sugar epimerase
MKYFVTGATGFIGGRVARQLAEAGHEVVALVRNPAKAQDLAAAGISLTKGDITEAESLRGPMEGVDGVFHIAGWYEVGTRDKSLGEAINVQGTRNVLQAMRDLHIPKGVYTSTLAVYSDTGGRLVDETYRFTGKHLSEYDRTKWVAHYEIAEPMQKAGLPLVIVHPGLVYGPGDKSAMATLLRNYVNRKQPFLPAKTAFCWTHVDDSAHGHILAMEKGKAGESYNICGPRYTLVDALKVAEQLTGVPAPRLHFPPAALKATAALMSVIERFIRVPDQYTSEYLRVAAGVTYVGDDSKARRDLGFAPRPLADGLRDTLAWLKQPVG